MFEARASHQAPEFDFRVTPKHVGKKRCASNDGDGGRAWWIGPGTRACLLGSYFPYGGTTTESLGFGWGVRVRTSPQRLLLTFTLPVRRHHKEFRVGEGHEGWDLVPWYVV